jgi:4-hydroxy-4-methyl-2-oxoglutarate aldolase
MNFPQIKRKILKLSTTHFCDVSKNIKLLDSKIHQIVSKKVFGNAFTVDSLDNIDTVIKALEKAKRHDVLVISGSKSGRALAGEIFAAIAQKNKLSGIIIDGACRDVEGIRKVGLPFYAETISPQVANAKKLGRLQIPIKFGGFIIEPKDIIFGDENGIIAMSRDDFIALLPLAEAQLQRELLWLKKIKAGTKLQTVFKV